MSNIRPMSENGVKKALEDNGFKDEHEFKDEYKCGRSQYNIMVDIDTNQLVLVPIKESSGVTVWTDYLTKHR
jgi:hypothetical protein